MSGQQLEGCPTKHAKPKRGIDMEWCPDCGAVRFVVEGKATRWRRWGRRRRAAKRDKKKQLRLFE